MTVATTEAKRRWHLGRAAAAILITLSGIYGALYIIQSYRMQTIMERKSCEPGAAAGASRFLELYVSCAGGTYVVREAASVRAAIGYMRHKIDALERGHPGEHAPLVCSLTFGRDAKGCTF